MGMAISARTLLAWVAALVLSSQPGASFVKLDPSMMGRPSYAADDAAAPTAAAAPPAPAQAAELDPWSRRQHLQRRATLYPSTTANASLLLPVGASPATVASSGPQYPRPRAVPPAGASSATMAATATPMLTTPVMGSASAASAAVETTAPRSPISSSAMAANVSEVSAITTAPALNATAEAAVKAAEAEAEKAVLPEDATGAAVDKVETEVGNVKKAGDELQVRVRF